jgi:hypothetical protein
MVTSISMLVVVLGMVTGNALVMLATSLAALLAIAALDWQRLSRLAIFAAVVATVSAAIAVAISRL